MKSKPDTLTEKLRLSIVRNKVQTMCKQKYHKEQNDPNGYDVTASCVAIADYESLALHIESCTAEEFLNVLAEKSEYAQQHCAFPGEFSGGKATYGSLQNDLQYWYQHKLINYSFTDLLIRACYQRFLQAFKK
ncbi:hypothetical protein [Psychromonas arctica]|uniref:hypothetical protein n=1 Tax=Psychromonas arctica TaxID=168275 RepID=UPI000425E9B7|nr:hypothetical protein [Psychromonas arctica]